MAGYVMRQFTCPKAVTHPSTNRARCRAIASIETNALPLHQTTNLDVTVCVDTEPHSVAFRDVWFRRLHSHNRPPYVELYCDADLAVRLMSVCIGGGGEDWLGVGGGYMQCHSLAAFNAVCCGIKLRCRSSVRRRLTACGLVTRTVHAADL